MLKSYLMTCQNCGKTSNPGDRFCAQCGHNLGPGMPPPLTGIQPANGMNAKNQQVNDLGYLLIAAITLVNVIIWRLWSLLSISYDSGAFLGMRAFSIMLIAAEFSIMFFFSKKLVFRILIGVIFGIVLLNNLVDLIQFSRI